LCSHQCSIVEPWFQESQRAVTPLLSFRIDPFCNSRILIIGFCVIIDLLLIWLNTCDFVILWIIMFWISEGYFSNLFIVILLGYLLFSEIMFILGKSRVINY
jgi:hypothetical protein